MAQITHDSLLTLEAYARARPEFRARVMAHKKHRTVALGEHVTLIFEDELTIRYQIQEMLRAERIFEDDGIQSELDAYNPLVPDGTNWKATMLIEYPDEKERREMLARLIGIEPPAMPDTETSFAELQARCDKTVAFIEGCDPAAFSGSEDREVSIKFPNGMGYRFTGGDYLRRFALPNFYFHATMAYAILRAQGISIGKPDYLQHLGMPEQL